MIDQTQAKEEKNKLLADAISILEGGKKNPVDILALAKSLHGHDEFGWARKILDKAVNQGIDDKQLKQQLVQKLAVSTYKDTHLNRERALDLALDILGESFDLTKTKDQETLGIAGSIYKKKWETDGIKVNLEQALIYYERGYLLGVEGDKGYTAINAAYTLDLLAYLEQRRAGKQGESSGVADKRRKDAVKIRENIIRFLSDSLKDEQLDKQNYWPMATLAEAYFGTQQYADAKKWLNNTLKIPDIPQWQYLAAAKQLVNLARYQADVDISDEALEKTQAWKVLKEFLGDKAEALRSISRGKLGLALSGGGFRASFYHIGVLAKLAELDLLRHVEVLSCVSGGSILGAHYYLELRRLINVEKKKDGEIDRDDYVRMIQNLVDDFLAGVQENPRVRLLANPWNNLKIIFSPHYSRTQRLGELYEELIYKRVEDGEGQEKRWLNGLYLYPEDKQDFLPRQDNWSRQCKLPELVLNSTTLNTGHNWQFTASWMGEPPAQIEPDVDTNDRYRRSYYHEAPDPHKHLRLGSAVGASSCVPGLFEPVVFQELYQDTTVRLVDGGIYDNQGVTGLLEQDCNVIIASDATGQMNTEKDPGGGVLKPLLRSNTALMQRVRDSQYQDLKARAKAGILKGFAYVHLKQGVEGENVDWSNGDEQKQSQTNDDAKTEYGIRRDIQELLAGIRTDLDSFSDLEAYALMTSGYCAIEKPVQQYLNDFPISKGDRPEWKFLKVEAAMKQDKAEGAEFERLKENLEASSLTFGKVWKLDKRLNILRTAVGVIFILGLVYIGYTNPELRPFNAILSWLGDKLEIGMILKVLFMMLIVIVVSNVLGAGKGRAVKNALNIRDLLRRIVVGLGLGLVGSIGALIHLHFFDKLFQKIGRVE